MQYHIYGSSSAGNCVVIDDLMFDIGVPFSKIHDALYGVKFILITHVHVDHLRIATYNKIRKLFPNIVFVGDIEVAMKVKIDFVAHEGEPLQLGRYQFVPFKAPHDVQVLGYTWQSHGKDFLYVTDTYSMAHCPDHEYDYFFLEANHDKAKVQAAMDSNKKYGYNAIAGSLRHLSIQDAKTFYYLHRKGPESLWVQLHKSSRFY